MRLRIFTEKLAAEFRRGCVLQLFEDAVELRERLKANRKRDFADAQIRIAQEIAGLLDAAATDVGDKIFAGDLLELLAQVVRAHLHRLRDSLEREPLIRLRVNEVARFPDFYRFSTISVQRGRHTELFVRDLLHASR